MRSPSASALKIKVSISATSKLAAASHKLPIEKIDQLLPELSSAIAAKDWDTVKSKTVKLKYLQGINAAAEAWPNRVHDH